MLGRGLCALPRVTRSLEATGPRYSSSSSVLVEHIPDKKVAVITLNDPSKLNALTADMGDRFAEVIRELSGEAGGESCKNLGAVVLTGSGRAFSAGGDLNFLRDRANDTPVRNSVVMRRFYERFLSVRKLPIPVVAAINGPAIGAGLCLALACDVRVASASAKLGITFVGLGLHPGMGATHFLPKVAGPQVAARMMLTGETISGAQALKDGVVAEVAPDGEAAKAQAIAMATQMAAAAPLAVRTCCRSLRMAQDEGLERALWREADAQAQVWNSGDMTEGLDALVARRKPEFKDYHGHSES